MEVWERAIAHIAAQAAGAPLPAGARIAIAFHPERLHVATPGDTAPVIERLQAGEYLPQFVTGLSSGGLTARPGGDRWVWESRSFGGAYDAAAPRERPVYGAVQTGDGIGGALRFGSSWLELRSSVLERVTLCWPDSAWGPTRFGTAEHAGSLLELASSPSADPLNDYLEAHVHGGVQLARDAELLVLDPSFKGTRVEAVAANLAIPYAWGEGRVLNVRALAGAIDYRGPQAVGLILSLARDGLIDARQLGDAAARGHLDPSLLRKAWHLVARFGEPATSG